MVTSFTTHINYYLPNYILVLYISEYESHGWIVVNNLVLSKITKITTLY